MVALTSPSIWYTVRATGIVALILLTATMVLGILTAGRLRTRTWPAFAQSDVHKWVSLLAMVFLGLHVVTAVLDTYVPVGWLATVIPFASPYRPLWTGLGTVGVDLMLAVAISSALRQRISARAWRTIHWLAYASWPVAMAHSLGEGTDASKLWMDAIAGACANKRQAIQMGATPLSTTRSVSPLPPRPGRQTVGASSSYPHDGTSERVHP
jgi:sulfoxide reductase heme-binding subunit YedZ